MSFGREGSSRSGALELAGGDVGADRTTPWSTTLASYETLLQALTELGTQTCLRVANIPIFFVGHSWGDAPRTGLPGSCRPVAGFLPMKGGCHNPGPALAAADVPGYFLIGALDEQYRRDNITGVFEAGRAAGARWAVSIDAFQHGPIVDFDLMFDWIDAVLTARLPTAAGAPLRAMTETSGWLGDRSSGRFNVRVHGFHPFERKLVAPRIGARLAGMRGNAVVSAATDVDRCPSWTF